MNPIVVVSHSLSFTVKCRPRKHDADIDSSSEVDSTPFVAERENSPSGLGTALSRLVARIDDAVWVASPGGHFKPEMDLPESNRAQNSATCSRSVWNEIKSARIQPVFIDDKVHRRYLNETRNSLWPLLHSLSSYAHFSVDNWLAYIQVNTEFARVTLDLVTERRRKNSNTTSPVVWIHDYHLMMMPLILRRMLDDCDVTLSSPSSSSSTLSIDSEDQSEDSNSATTQQRHPMRIVFSLHTPFPSWDLFRLGPWSRDLLTGLLAAHLICFVSPSHASNFLECCSRVLGAHVNRHDMLVEYEGRTSVVKYMPVGFDYEWYEHAAQTCDLDIQEKAILGIDRLDYTKGLIERVLGYERLLEKHPELCSKTVLLQIVTPPAHNNELDSQRNMLKQHLDREIARVCGRFATPNWAPIRYIYQTLSESELMRMYARASVGLVNGTSQQWAKEFIACASTSAVLVMSVFGSGSAESSAAALLANPLEKDMLADAIKLAIDMDLDERCTRMINLKTSLKRFDVKAWASAICEAVMQTPKSLSQFNKIPSPAILASFVDRRQKKKNVKSSIERHEPSIVKSSIKNIV